MFTPFRKFNILFKKRDDVIVVIIWLRVLQINKIKA